jgi:hypothetical protein
MPKCINIPIASEGIDCVMFYIDGPISRWTVFPLNLKSQDSALRVANVNAFEVGNVNQFRSSCVTKKCDERSTAFREAHTLFIQTYQFDIPIRWPIPLESDDNVLCVDSALLTESGFHENLRMTLPLLGFSK